MKAVLLDLNKVTKSSRGKVNKLLHEISPSIVPWVTHFQNEGAFDCLLVTSTHVGAIFRGQEPVLPKVSTLAELREFLSNCQ